MPQYFILFFNGASLIKPSYYFMQHFYVKITQPFYRIFGKGRRGREEDVPKENFCGWFICGQHCAKPTHQYTIEKWLIHFGKKRVQPGN